MSDIIPYCYLPQYQYQEDNPFVDTERFSPVRYLGDLPDNRDPYHIKWDEWDETEKDLIARTTVVDEAWWHKQESRCRNGFTIKNGRKDGSDVTITGRNYFYLNFCPIFGLNKDSKNKAKILTLPRFTDMDFEEWWVAESAFQTGKDNQWYKSRQKGFTSKSSGGLLAYNFFFIPSSQNIIIAGNDDDAENLMFMTKRAITYMRNTQFFKELSHFSNDQVVAKNYLSQIHKLTAGSQGMQTISRFSPTLVIFEEEGKWPKGLLRATRSFVEPSLYSETKKTGTIFYIGTGGDLEGGAADIEEMHYNPEAYNLLEFKDIYEPEHMRRDKPVGRFIPSWRYTIIDKDGNSLKKESIKFHEEEAKKKKKYAKILYWVNNPIYASQGFMVPSGGYFGEQLQAKIIERRSEIVKRKNNVLEYGNLEWRDKKDWSKGVVFKPGPNEEGQTYWAITERPKIDPGTGLPYKNLYKQTTDSYDKDEADSSTSKGSSIIGHGVLDSKSASNYPVARITIRPEVWHGGAKRFYEEVLKGNIYYNAINLIEYSQIRIFDFYKDAGYSHLLKERPKLMIAKWIQDSKVSNEYGIDPSTKPYWLSELNDYLLSDNTFEALNKIYDPEILTALAKFRYNPGRGRYNCDITITMALLAVLFEDEKELEVKKSQDQERYSLPNITYKRVGNTFKIINN